MNKAKWITASNGKPVLITSSGKKMSVRDVKNLERLTGAISHLRYTHGHKVPIVGGQKATKAEKVELNNYLRDWNNDMLSVYEGGTGKLPDSSPVYHETTNDYQHPQRILDLIDKVPYDEFWNMANDEMDQKKTKLQNGKIVLRDNQKNLQHLYYKSRHNKKMKTDKDYAKYWKREDYYANKEHKERKTEYNKKYDLRGLKR